MKITLSEKEALKIIFSALANGGLSELSAAEVDIAIGKEYDRASDRLEGSPCYEDVLVEVLRGGDSLKFIDFNDKEEISFNLEKAMKNISKDECLELILAYQQEEDDAWTGFDLLQHCLYGEVLYG